MCEVGETRLNCPEDCLSTQYCGDNSCDSGNNENCGSCSQDCGLCDGASCTSTSECQSGHYCSCGVCSSTAPPECCSGADCDDENPSTTDSCSGGQCIYSDPCPGANDYWSGSQCVCDSGYANCDGSSVNGCEVQLGTISNCLSCGNNCNDGLYCTADSCTVSGCTHTNTCATGNCIPPAPGTCTQCSTSADCTSPPQCYQLPATCSGGSCQYQTAPSTTQCGTDTLCSYTGCSGICGRTGTYTDYHCTGFGSCQGYATTCSPLTCSAGTKCSSGSCVSATETCNNIDDNCNGQVDENLQTSSGCNQVGYCSGSYKTCSAGIWGACSKTPQTEVCDGIDNNCNGQIDEGCDDDADGYCDDNMEIKAAVTGSTGLCKNEMDAPPANAKGTDCDDDEKNSNPGKTEICDFLDNNCNGQIDENGVCSCDKLLGLGKTEKAKISKNKP